MLVGEEEDEANKRIDNRLNGRDQQNILLKNTICDDTLGLVLPLFDNSWLNLSFGLSVKLSV